MDSVIQVIEFIGALFGALMVLYVATRLVALAWYSTKAEYNSKLITKLLADKGDHHGSEKEKE